MVRNEVVNVSTLYSLREPLAAFLAVDQAKLAALQLGRQRLSFV
jgi:hypothetical protein